MNCSCFSSPKKRCCGFASVVLTFKPQQRYLCEATTAFFSWSESGFFVYKSTPFPTFSLIHSLFTNQVFCIAFFYIIFPFFLVKTPISSLIIITMSLLLHIVLFESLITILTSALNTKLKWPERSLFLLSSISNFLRFLYFASNLKFRPLRISFVSLLKMKDMIAELRGRNHFFSLQ